MSEQQLYVLGVSLSVLTSLLLVLYLRKPLYKLLVDLCRTEDRARFWVQITNISFFLGATFMALSFRPHEPQPTHYFLASIMSRTLFGLLGVTGFLTIMISAFAARQDKRKAKASS
ncbi:MAG TPA: hypothetical protein VJ965_10350 [Anaerolineales bacterium]|nr:hypothetical protein [Anaerolineales bacterium]